MTLTDREVMQMALEYLDRLVRGMRMGPDSEAAQVCACLRETLDQPQLEPVAWMCADESLMHKGYSRFSPCPGGDWNIPVYTHPPRREWQGLTEKDKLEIRRMPWESPGDLIDNTEARLKEKNA